MTNQGFLSETWTPSEIYTQTSYKARSIDSGRSQLTGIYDNTLVWPEIYTQQPVNTISDDIDHIVHLDGNNCIRFGEVKEAIEANADTKKMYDEMNADWETNFFPRLRELTEDPDADTDTCLDYMNYLEWAHRSNLPLKFELNDDDVSQIYAAGDRKTYWKFLADKQLEVLPGYEFFQQFNEYMKVIEDGATWHDLPYFKKYFNLYDQKDQVATFPKFIFFSGHAETVGPLFEAFGHTTVHRAEPASAIFLEFFTLNETGKNYVKIFYKTDPSAEPVVFDLPLI
jgi:hypothetical protein